MCTGTASPRLPSFYQQTIFVHCYRSHSVSSSSLLNSANPKMDIIPQNYPMVNYILSRIPSMKSPRSEVDIEQPRPETTSTQEAKFVDPLVERMPHLKDPKVVAEMAKAVLEISQTRSVLRALGDRPDHETVDKAKEKVAEIESNLTNQLEDIALSPRPNDVEQNDWRSVLTDKEKERRGEAEKEKAMYNAIIRLDEMHAEYQKLLKDAELRLMKIYDSAAARREEGEGSGKDIDASVGEDKAESSRSRELVDEEVVEILKADAAGKQINMVNLSGRCLKILPEAFGRIRSLVSLNLSDNQLECLPDSIAGLEHLQELNLSSNILEFLPDSIGLLMNLKVLNVSGNKLNALPDSICHCRSLVELDASFNNLTYLPTYLGQEMVCLRRLSVQYNKLHTLPTSIGGMKSLQHLDVHFNELHGLPTCIGVLTNLETLNLSGNFSDLSSLPESFGELINLKELDLSNNQIHELPSTFGRLENLVKLNLEHNPITIPPLEVVNEGVEAVREYMSQRWINLLVEEEERKAQKMKEEAETTGWLRNSFSRSTSWLKRSLSSVSDYLVSPDGPSKDPCLDQQL